MLAERIDKKESGAEDAEASCRLLIADDQPHILEALRLLDHPCTAVFITTDKCYENREWVYAYREADPLGGHDPYSSSKAGAELAVAAWRRSFFASGAVKIATARAGNVFCLPRQALKFSLPRRDCYDYFFHGIL